MTYYPGYTVDKVLDELATRFYNFLDYAIEIEAKNIYRNLDHSTFPYLNYEDRKEILDKYKLIFDDEPIIVSADVIKQDRERLRNLMASQKHGKRQK